MLEINYLIILCLTNKQTVPIYPCPKKMFILRFFFVFKALNNLVILIKRNSKISQYLFPRWEKFNRKDNFLIYIIRHFFLKLLLNCCGGRWSYRIIYLSLLKKIIIFPNYIMDIN